MSFQHPTLQSLMKAPMGAFLINGEWKHPRFEAGSFTCVNPATDTPLVSVPNAGVADVDDAVAAARAAFDDLNGWSHWPVARRAEALARISEVLNDEQTKNRLAMLSALSVGKPFQEALLDVSDSAYCWKYFGELAVQHLTQQESSIDSKEAPFGGSKVALSDESFNGYVRSDPLGVVAGSSSNFCT